MRSRLSGLLLVAVLLGMAPAAHAGSQDDEAADLTVAVDLRLQADGALHVTERVTVPEGQEAGRDLPLRVPDGPDAERVYGVDGLEVAGPGEAEVDRGTLVTTAPAGETELSYVVTGAVADGAGEQLLTWHPTGWWDAAVDRVAVSFLAPTPAVSIAGCHAGPPGSTSRCTQAAIGHEGVLEIDHQGLGDGERIELLVGLPEGTVPATAQWDEARTLARALAITPPVLIAFGALALLALAAVGAVTLARRRDLRALAAGTARDVIVHDGEEVRFSPPHGARPGQTGTVITASVDPVDLAASVLDLAVRRHLRFEEVVAEDGALQWRLRRSGHGVDALREDEQALLGALLPGEEPVPLTELGDDGLDLDAVRAATYSDVLGRGWFADRSGRGLPSWVGGALVLGGAAAAVVLALTVGHALIGLALMGLGALVALGPRFLPLRTPAGGEVAGDLLAMRAHLHRLDPEDLPQTERELLFSRGLPYAVVLGETGPWLRKFADLAPSDSGEPGIFWFGGFEGCADLRRFGAHFPHVLAELEGAFADADHQASLGGPLPD